MSMFNSGFFNGNRKEQVPNLASGQNNVEEKDVVKQEQSNEAELQKSEPVNKSVATKSSVITPKTEAQVMLGASVQTNAEASVKADIKMEKKEQSKSSEDPEPRKIIKFSKTGVDHNIRNLNNQDFVFSFMNVKAVCDGCGSGKHSEVGSILFGQLFAREVHMFIDCVKKHNPVRLSKYAKPCDGSKFYEQVTKGEIPEEAFLGILNNVFEKLLSLCDETTFIFENYCFTILVCLEYENEFVVYSCGDGFIIKESAEGITFEKLDDGEYPAYYVYNWVDPADLKEYKVGVQFKVARYSKKEYINIGVASDGLRYFDDLYEPYQELKDESESQQGKFKYYLSVGKSAQLEMLITKNNRKSSTFKDDISICF